jgi:hypothetical protein
VSGPGELIAYNDRVLVLGATGRGKSVLLNHLGDSFRCQRLVIDTKGHEWAIPGVEPVSTAAELDWRLPILHYASTSAGDLAELERVFSAAYERRNLLVVVHELADLCDFQPNQTPRSVKTYVSMGRAHGLGLLGGSQRPVEMPKRSRTEVEHVFIFPRPDPGDMPVLAQLAGVEREELLALLEQVHAEHGLHGFLWVRRGAAERLVRCPPLPEGLTRRSLATKRTVA